MSKIHTLREDDLGGGLYRRVYLLIRKNPWSWQSVGAAFGIAGGVFSLTAGLLSWAIVRLLAPVGSGSFLNASAILFPVFTFPLLALGAHCLDLLEKKPPLLPPPARSRVGTLEPRLLLRQQPRHKW